jgi:hypothetical protein
MKRLSFVQWSGWLFVLSGLMESCLAVYAANNVAQVQSPLAAPTTASIIWNSLATVSRLLFFVGALGLACSGAVGHRWWGRVGVVIFALGAGLNVLVSGSEISNITLTSLMLDGATESLAGLGITIAGIAIIVERRWQGWRRYMPLLSALYVWLVITPAAIVNPGGPALHWAVAGAGVITVLLGVAQYVEARQEAHAAPAF